MNGLSYVDQFDTENFPVKIVGAVKDFDCTEYIDKKEAKRMDRFTQFAVCSAKQALKMAGSDFKDVDPFKAGVIIGVGIGGLNMTEKEVTKFNESLIRYQFLYPYDDRQYGGWYCCNAYRL